MGVMPSLGLVFNVGGGNCDTTFSLFWSFVNGAILEKAGQALLCLSLGDSRSKSGLEVIRSGSSGISKQ